MAIAQRRKAVTASMASPIGGWNARDSLAEMSPLDAVELINWFPTPSDVSLRKGYSKHSIGITGNVDSLMNYAGPTDQKLFAAAATNIYDATVSPATSVFSITNDRLQHVMISTAGGDFLVACNGQDPTMVYDGTRWFSIATTTTAPAVSTLTRIGTLATVTTATPHNLADNNRVTITGATGPDGALYNGTFVIDVTGANTFTYVMTGTPTADAAGTIVYTVLGITGVNSNTFIHVNLFKNRLWFTQKDTMKVWYLPVDSIGGAAEAIDFGGIARKGGFLQAMGTWTLDAGEGADDYAVFVSSMGEVMVYNGTDPTTAATWALKGVWNLGQTFTRRCFFKYSGDLLLLTKDGLTPLASALQSSRLDPRVNLTDKIYYAISQAANAYSNQFGWQINYLASANMLIINVPNGTTNEQYVMHSITKSWAKFTGIDAICFEIHKDSMYFGSSAYVGKFYDTNSDNNSNINATVQQAYSYFEARGQLKRFTMIRPIFLTAGGIPTIVAGVNIDFDTQNVTGTVTFNPATVVAGRWDNSNWDDANWGGGLQVSKVWQGVTGIGYSAGVYMTVASQNIDVRWASTDYVMEQGGVI